MKEISLFTKTKITASRVSQKIISSFPWKKKIVQNDDGELFLGTIPREFYIVYDDSCDINDEDCLFEEADKLQIPFPDSQVNDIFYRDEQVVKHVLSIIALEYPEMYIMDDEGNIMPVFDFINNV